MYCGDELAHVQDQAKKKKSVIVIDREWGYVS